MRKYKKGTPFAFAVLSSHEVLALFLGQCFATLVKQVRWATTLSLHLPVRLKEAFRQHQKIFEALRFALGVIHQVQKNLSKVPYGICSMRCKLVFPSLAEHRPR